MAVSVNKNKQPTVSTYFKSSRNNTVLPALGNFFIDAIRGSMNRSGDVADYLVDKPARKGPGIGDFIIGRAPTPLQSRPVTPATAPTKNRIRPASAYGASDPSVPSQDQPETIADTLARYLAMANSLGMGGGNGIDYGALIGQLKSNAAQGDARLAAMYNQLQNSFKADATGIGQNYDNTSAALAKNAADASANINGGYQAARDAQTKQFEALGIQDAAKVLAANGGLAARDQANAVGNVQQGLAANSDLNASNKAAALNFNTGVSNAAGLEGAVQRATLQQQLANKLAELQTQQGANKAAGRSSALSAAMQLMQMDPNSPTNVLRMQSATVNSELQKQMLAAKLQGQMLKNQNAQAAMGQGPDAGSSYVQLQQMFKAAGGDPANQDTFGKFIQQMVNSGKVKLG